MAHLGNADGIGNKITISHICPDTAILIIEACNSYNRRSFPFWLGALLAVFSVPCNTSVPDFNFSANGGFLALIRLRRFFAGSQV